MVDQDDKDKRRALPDARLINSSLYIKDVYTPKKGKPGTPKYKCEIAIEDTEENRDLLDEICAECAERYLPGGADRYYEDDAENPIMPPMKDGDKMAAKREKNGKPGDAYKGMLVLRLDTIYNFEGDIAGGGIAVYDEDVKRIVPAESGKIYNGCYVQVVCSANTYEDDEGVDHIKFYLNSVQKVADGERLVEPADHSDLFTKRVRKNTDSDEGEKTTTRRRKSRRT